MYPIFIIYILNVIFPFPQADVKVYIYVHTSQGVDFGEDSYKIILILKKKNYILQDVERAWWENISIRLNELSFYSTEIDQYVFIKDDVIILIYMDDCILMSKKNNKIIRII